MIKEVKNLFEFSFTMRMVAYHLYNCQVRIPAQKTLDFDPIVCIILPDGGTRFRSRDHCHTVRKNSPLIYAAFNADFRGSSFFA